ncbi:MAG: MFS transporter [Actinomycetota bacterium]|nr:MFS transporter [Actinomycetota bacterium]
MARTDLPTGTRIVGVYYATSALFTLATSIIWGVNTLFLLGAGLSLFEVMVVNAVFSAGQLVFEVPTGVVADTLGRKVSYLIGIASLFGSTLLYVAAARYEWGFAGFAIASVLLGFGYTCQTGAVDAWLIDALDHVEYDKPREQVFARAGMLGGIAMLTGTLAGGFIGQVNLSLPYIVRSVILLAAFALVLVAMREIGFEPRPLKASRFAEETRTIARAGATYGWNNPVVRPLLFVSAAQGAFMMFFFYSSQPFALQLLGRSDLVWVAGALTALFGATGVVGNALVGRAMKSKLGADPTRLLAWCAAATAGLTVAIALVGLMAPAAGDIRSFAAMVVIMMMFGIVFGVAGPVRQAFINRQIPTAQRATVLSIDAFFRDAGAMTGQPALGWLATRTSIPLGYLVGSLLLGAAAPLYRMAGRGSRDPQDAAKARDADLLV